MGESARRKSRDPNYGQPIRGLILTSPIIPNPTGGLTARGSVDPHQLRHAVLFWDKLVWPSNNIIHLGGDQDTEFLETAKILERPRYTVGGAINVSADLFVQSQLAEFKKRDASGKGIWDICQNTSILLSAMGRETDSKGLGFELVNAIPVPDKDVPLNEILEFKHKRNAEFVALRAELDQLSNALLNSPENPVSEFQRAVDHIDKACADTMRVCGEWQFPVCLSNQKMTLDLKPFELVAGGVLGVLAIETVHMSATQAVVAGLGGALLAAKTTFKITADIGLQSMKRRLSPFAYVAQAHKQLF